MGNPCSTWRRISTLVFCPLTETRSSPDDDGIHGHRAGAAIDKADGMFARTQTSQITHNLLGQARARDRHIRRRTALAVNLNLDSSGACFL